MKKGKFITLNTHNSVKIGYGTVDYKNLKTIYLQLNSWLEPTSAHENDFDKIIQKTRRSIKEKFYSLNSQYFKPQCIVDLDIKTKEIKNDKRSFMDLEITLYVNEYFDVRSKDIKQLINDITTDIIDNTLTNKNLFIFFETKN